LRANDARARDAERSSADDSRRSTDEDRLSTVAPFDADPYGDTGSGATAALYRLPSMDRPQLLIRSVLVDADGAPFGFNEIWSSCMPVIVSGAVAPTDSPLVLLRRGFWLSVVAGGSYLPLAAFFRQGSEAEAASEANEADERLLWEPTDELDPPWFTLIAKEVDSRLGSGSGLTTSFAVAGICTRRSGLGV